MADDPSVAGLDGERRLWRAATIDPIFVATAPGGGRIARGWYTATASIEARAGDKFQSSGNIHAVTEHLLI